MLSGHRFRLRTGDGWVSAEKGYLREVGNLLFHLALLALLGSVGIGGIFGYKANRLLVTGDSFANTVTALDQFRPGRLVSAADLQPFSVTLDNFSARYVTSGEQRGQPASFDATLSYTERPGAPARRYSLRVNHPLEVDDVRVFLIGHGYAPEFRVTDSAGRVVFSGAVPFIPVEQVGLTSDGVIKVPDASPDQLGFAGVFLPTMVDVGGSLRSAFPAALNPRVSLLAYAGNLGMNSGPAQSVYQLDTGGLRQLPVAPQALAVGQSMKLPNGPARSPSPATGSGSAWPSPTTPGSCPRCGQGSRRWPACCCRSWSGGAGSSCAPTPGPMAAQWSTSAGWPGPTRPAGWRTSSPAWPPSSAKPTTGGH